MAKNEGYCVWNAMPYSLVEVYRRFGRMNCSDLEDPRATRASKQLAASNLKMKAVRSSESSVNF
jgi:hypothetical protein